MVNAHFLIFGFLFGMLGAVAMGIGDIPFTKLSAIGAILFYIAGICLGGFIWTQVK